MGCCCGSVVQQLLLTPEVRDSYRVIGKIYIEHLFTLNCNEKAKIKAKEAGKGPLKSHIEIKMPLNRNNQKNIKLL